MNYWYRYKLLYCIMARYINLGCTLLLHWFAAACEITRLSNNWFCRDILVHLRFYQSASWPNWKGWLTSEDTILYRVTGYDLVSILPAERQHFGFCMLDWSPQGSEEGCSNIEFEFTWCLRVRWFNILPHRLPLPVSVLLLGLLNFAYMCTRSRQMQSQIYFDNISTSAIL